MKIKMIDGSEIDLKDFDYECDARDNAGRHFSGQGECIFDLRGDVMVSPEFRNIYSVEASFDGDWGASFEYCEFQKVKPIPVHRELLDLTLAGGDLGVCPTRNFRLTITEILS